MQPIDVNQILGTGKPDYQCHNEMFPFSAGDTVICTEVPELYRDFIEVGKVYKVDYDDTMHLGIKDKLWGKLFNTKIGFRNPKYFIRKNSLSSLLWGIE